MPSSRKVAIWDAPIRLFHWCLVLLIAACWLTESLGWMPLHFLCGEAVLALILFRVVWGFVGSDTARFGFFLRSPAEALRHLAHLPRREPDTEVGHNAAGGWMVLGLLGLLLVQTGTGLFSNDDDSFTEGPLRHSVSKELSDRISDVHEWTFTLIEIAVVLHVLAIVVYLVLKGHNLVRPMIFGTKDLPDTIPAPRLVSPMAAAAILLVCAAIVAAAVRWL
jgi:cytochrome b